MSRLVKPVAALIAVFVLLFYLQSRVGEQPLTRHQEPVSQDALR